MLCVAATVKMSGPGRYGRQTLVLGGNANQDKISTASVCVIGAGGLGSTVIYFLAGAGVGTISVVDNDCVEESNLHRQIIHDMDQIGDSVEYSCS